MTEGPAPTGPRPGPSDPGLQAERTALAWQRTGISGALVGGLAVLTAAHDSSILVLALTAGLAAAAAGAAGYASRPMAADRRAFASPWGRLVATAAIPILLAASGILIARS